MTAMWRGAPIVGFCGRAGVGKTTAADYLCTAYGFERIRFAGPLKAMLRALGLTDAEVDGDLKEQPSALLCGRSPRQAMQWLGTEWGRMLIGPDLWLNAWDAQARARRSRGTLITVDDVRFANEAQAIWGMGGIIVKIAAGTEPPPAHISETIGFRWDAEILNAQRGLSAFYDAVDGLHAVETFAAAPRDYIPGKTLKHP